MKSRILVVDDDYASAKTMAWAMETTGRRVRIAHDGASALQITREYAPDAVLLDLGMPGMDGYEVCLEMREDPKLKDTLFIAQTGWASEGHRRLSKLAGFHHHLVKPVNLKTLQRLLDED